MSSWSITGITTEKEDLWQECTIRRIPAKPYGRMFYQHWD
jgi:hypothetical protein